MKNLIYSYANDDVTAELFDDGTCVFYYVSVTRGGQWKWLPSTRQVHLWSSSGGATLTIDGEWYCRWIGREVAR